MNVQELFDAALALIEQHNQEVGENNPGVIKEPQNVVACLKAAGGTSEERLRGFSYEDILAALPKFKIGDTEIKPVALAKDLAKLFRGKQETTEKKLPHPTAVARMTLRQLVENLDPEDYTSPVAKRLGEEFAKGRKFIVFSEDRVVDVESTYRLISELRQGYDEVAQIPFNGDIRRVYRLGELPHNLVDENPFYPGRPLRSGAVCDQTNRSWAGIPLEVRQFICVGVVKQKFETGIESVHRLLDLILASPNPLNALRLRYAEVALIFDDLKNKSQLPTLKIELGPAYTPETEKGPFVGGKKVSPRTGRDHYFNQNR